jgi:hypothetical protein
VKNPTRGEVDRHEKWQNGRLLKKRWFIRRRMSFHREEVNVVRVPTGSRVHEIGT